MATYMIIILVVANIVMFRSNQRQTFLGNTFKSQIYTFTIQIKCVKSIWFDNNFWKEEENAHDHIKEVIREKSKKISENDNCVNSWILRGNK